MPRREDDRSEGDPYQTTPRIVPRLANETASEYETRRSISHLHQRVDMLFGIIARGNEARQTLAGQVAELVGKLDLIDSIDKRTSDEGEGHGKRIRTLENAEHTKTGRNSVISLIVGALGGFVTRLLFPHQ